MSRQRKEIDIVEFEKLCFLQCSMREMCEWLHLTEKTLIRRVREHYGEPFSIVFAKKRVGGLISLRRNMFRLAEKNPAVSIFLAKNYLGMADKQEIEHTGNLAKPIGVAYVNFDAETVAQAITEAIRLRLDPRQLGLNPALPEGNGHGENAALLSTSADMETAPVSES